MKKSQKLLAVWILASMLLSVWWVNRDLQRRFPDMDFSKARFVAASWYSEDDAAIEENTANGEEFNDRAMTCAVQNYPFDKKLLVLNPLNGKFVICRVNDRGPAKRLGRGIDLTRAAFKKIGNLDKGLLRVMLVPSKN
jgi:rare lipoprotein A (peptidoglycan hydrolase)